jgi:rhodanese-related sulfurtransferase
MNATLFLRNRGKEKVWSLAGGIDLWSKTIDPTVPRY